MIMKQVKDKVIGIVIIFIINSITIFMNSKEIIGFIINLIPEGINIVAMSPTDVLGISISISCLFSFIIILPIVLYCILEYLDDALYDEEKKIISWILFLGTLLFIFGAALSFYSFMFFGLEWFAAFNTKYSIQTLWSLQQTIGTILTMSFISGIIFEFPIVLFYLIKKNIIKFRLDGIKRLILLLVITLVLGIVTPDGSMFTQLILTVPVYLLAEISICLGNKFKEVKK